ncbi:hypothetical protein BWK69_01335 [Candidatus Parcubacteria bacterium A4]|nr:MAG: hypothetical protein BWK69_01335 [Candidatus Parcubacteria bacterium A4]
MEKLKDKSPSQEIEKIEKIAQENFSRWNKSLLTKDPAKVAELYAKGATFLPTVSGEFKNGPSGAKTYFSHFLEKNPSGKIIQEKIQNLGSGCYLHCGMYNFEIGPDDQRQIVEARFTFLWQQDEKGEWKIAHHHSSIKPKE